MLICSNLLFKIAIISYTLSEKALLYILVSANLKLFILENLKHD